MKLNIKDEFSPLKKMIVSSGENIPLWYENQNRNPQLKKFLPAERKWDRDLLIKQQHQFLKAMEKYKVKLLFPKFNKNLPWQMCTRDVGFVYHDKFFYCERRTLKEREGEIVGILEILSGVKPKNIIKIEVGKIEGGDVLIDEEQLYIGLSNRTNLQAVKVVEKYFPGKRLPLGDNIMHLDTCMAILPNRTLLIYPGAFQKEDLTYLRKRFKFITISKDEAGLLGTNVLVVNPQTIIVHKWHSEVQKKLKEEGFRLEIIDYSEPIKTGGSFRCSALPLERS